MDVILRPALGSTANLGDMYNAKTDSFMGISALKRPIPETALVTADSNFSDTKYERSESITDRYSKLDIGIDLKLSILLGSVSLGGSAGYLRERKRTSKTAQESLVYSIKTKDQKLNILHEDMINVIHMDAILKETSCTNIVTEVRWGANTVLTCQIDETKESKQDDIQGKVISQLEEVGHLMSLSFEADKKTIEKGDDEWFKYHVYRDVVPSGKVPTNKKDAVRLMQEVPSLVEKTNNGFGKPLSFVLLPINVLTKHFGMPESALVQRIEQKISMKVVQFLEELDDTTQLLSTLKSALFSYKHYETKKNLENLEKLNNEFAIFANNVREDLRKIVEHNKLNVDDSKSIDLYLCESRKDELSPDNVKKQLTRWSTAYEMVNFIIAVKEKKAEYVTGKDLLDTTKLNGCVLYLPTKNPSSDAENFKMNSDLFFKEFHKKELGNSYIVVDGSHPSSPAKEQAVLQVFRNGTVVVDNLLVKRQLLQDKCVVQWERAPQKLVSEPANLERFKAKCAGKYCTPNIDCSWFCERCVARIKLGVDNLFYCDCGRSGVYDASYKCLHNLHGLMYVSHQPEYITAICAKLVPVSFLWFCIH